ncbi:MAG TPA: hypothetical protein VG603_03870 [Chitinophagales bacterium]|nr:hypothetical protein [Chitinophagales bacterium]
MAGFFKRVRYLSQEEYDELISKVNEVGKLLGHMIANPDKYLSKK